MASFDRKKVQTLIELSTTFEDANEVIEKFTDFNTYEEKIAFLMGMFDAKIIHRLGGTSMDDYVALLTGIVKYHGMA